MESHFNYPTAELRTAMKCTEAKKTYQCLWYTVYGIACPEENETRMVNENIVTVARQIDFTGVPSRDIEPISSRVSESWPAEISRTPANVRIQVGELVLIYAESSPESRLWIIGITDPERMLILTPSLQQLIAMGKAYLANEGREGEHFPGLWGIPSYSQLHSQKKTPSRP
ncbi:hypothetical protein Pelo_1796 [Pelomyxa schiedti]|nr:hypothetical protein Pelo_1796 [Pelomyxa schiedti]